MYQFRILGSHVLDLLKPAEMLIKYLILPSFIEGKKSRVDSYILFFLYSIFSFIFLYIFSIFVEIKFFAFALILLCN